MTVGICNSLMAIFLYPPQRFIGILKTRNQVRKHCYCQLLSVCFKETRRAISNELNTEPNLNLEP